MRESLLGFLKVNEVEYKESVSIREISPVKIGGTASIIIYPNNLKMLITVVNFLFENQIPYKIIGRISNILFRDDIIETVLIKTDKLKNIEISDEKAKFLCGDTIFENAVKLAKSGYSGISELSGIPGSIGGMMTNNAGAFGKSMSDIVNCAYVYFPKERKAEVLSKTEMMLGYRTSVFQSIESIVLQIEINLHKAPVQEILSEIYSIRSTRAKTQPVGSPSLGSVFKKPAVGYAAKLIEDAGLKGASIGDAQISKIHSGFIINKGSATSKDYRLLIEYVKSVIHREYGITLEEEIEYL